MFKLASFWSCNATSILNILLLVLLLAELRVSNVKFLSLVFWYGFFNFYWASVAGIGHGRIF